MNVHGSVQCGGVHIRGANFLIDYRNCPIRMIIGHVYCLIKIDQSQISHGKIISKGKMPLMAQ